MAKARKKESSAENTVKGKQSAALIGNTNALKFEKGTKVIRLSGTDTELLFDFFASEGNLDPTPHDFTMAVHYAISRVYGRKLEDDQAIIL